MRSLKLNIYYYLLNICAEDQILWSYYDKLGKNIPEIRRTYLSLNSLNICFYVHSINIRLCTNNYIFSNYLMLTKYLLSDNVLYFMDKDKSRKVIHNMEEAKEVLWLYHSNSMTGGHSGLNNTQNKLSTHYFWKNITQDVKEYVSKPIK